MEYHQLQGHGRTVASASDTRTELELGLEVVKALEALQSEERFEAEAEPLQMIQEQM